MFENAVTHDGSTAFSIVCLTASELKKETVNHSIALYLVYVPRQTWHTSHPVLYPHRIDTLIANSVETSIP